MRRINYLLFSLAGLVVLCLVLIVIVLVTFDNDDYRRLVARGVKLFSGQSVTIEGPFALVLSTAPSLSAEAIQFHPAADGSPPPVTTIGKLHIQVALKPLLSGVLLIRQLVAEDVVMAVTIKEDAKAEDGRVSTRRAASDIRIPIMESVRLRNIHLDVIDAAAKRTVEIRLRNVAVHDIRGTGQSLINGEGSVSGNDFKIEGRTGALAALLRGAEPFPVELDLTAPVFELAVSGTVQDLLGGKGLDLKLSAEAGELSNVFKLLHMEVPPLGHINVEASIAHDMDAPKVTRLDVRLVGDSRVAFAANGSIENAFTGEGADIQFSGLCENPDIFKMLLPENLPALNRVRMVGKLLEAQGEIAVEDLVIDAAAAHGLSVTADGRIDLGKDFHAPAIREVDLTASLKADSTRLLATGLGMEVPDLGAVSLRARIHGSPERFQLTEIDARTAHAKGLEIGLAGKIAFEPHRKHGLLGTVDLQARANAPTLGAAFIPLGKTAVPRLGALRASALVQGTTDVLSLRQIALRVGQTSSLQMEVNGEVGRIPVAGDRPISDVRLAALVRAKSTSALSAILGISIPDLGPVKVAGRIVDRKEIVGVRDISVLVGNEKNAALKATGTVASMVKDNDVAIDGIALVIEARDLGLKPFSDLIGKPLPDVGPMNGSFRITGSPAQLAVSRAKLSTVSPRGLTLTVTGGVDRIRLGGQKPLEGVDVLLSGTAPDSGALAALIDFELPDLGPLQIAASVNDGGNSLDVKSFDIRGGSDKAASFRMQGQILRVADLERMALQAAFEAASQPWVKKYMHQPQAENFPLAGTIKVRAAADGMIIDEARLGTTDGKSLILKTQGRLTRLSASPAFDLKLTASAADPHVIGSMVGVSLPLIQALDVDGRLNGSARKVVFHGETRIGKTAFTLNINSDFAGQRPRIDATVTAKVIDLEDMGFFPEAPVEDAPQTPAPESSKMSRLFDDRPLSFKALKAMDLFLDINADKLVGRDITIEKLELDVLLENGRLRIYPARMLYAAGFTSSEFVIDASGPIPQFMLKVSGEDIDVGDLLAYLHEPIIASGSLSLVVDLQSAGKSPREIASNLKGEIAMALENGRIRRIIKFLSVDAFDALLAAASRSTHTDLHCMINQIHFENGVGEIEIFYMDTPRIRARGAGNINLAAETVDVVLSPEIKRRLFRRGSPVRITGNLTAPSVRIIPGSEVAMLYGDIFLPYITIPKRILGFLWSLIRNDSLATPCVFEKR